MDSGLWCASAQAEKYSYIWNFRFDIEVGLTSAARGTAVTASAIGTSRTERTLGAVGPKVLWLLHLQVAQPHFPTCVAHADVDTVLVPGGGTLPVRGEVTAASAISMTTAINNYVSDSYPHS